MLPAETTVHKKWLPAKTVRVILLLAKSHGQSPQEAIHPAQVSAGSKRSRTVSAETKYDGQSLQETKISGLVYTLWLLGFLTYETEFVLFLAMLQNSILPMG